MANTIDKIPEKTRWEIATKGLTGAYIAISKALKEAVGQKKFEEFNGSLWYQAGKGAKEFADTLGIAAKNAEDIEGVTHLLAQASMGPEFVFEVVEATNDRCVGKTSQCPWHKRWKEQGVDFERSLSWVMYAPAGVPASVTQKISGALKASLAEPDIVEKLLALGISADFIAGDQQRDINARDIEAWKKVASDAKIEIK